MPEQSYQGSEIRSFGDYLRHQWNVFRNKDPIYQDIGQVNNRDRIQRYSPGMISYMHPDHRRLSPSIDRTIVSSIYTRIAVDACMAHIHHIKTDENGMFKEEIKSGLNNVLTCEANIDQTGTAFLFDFILSMLDEGVVAGVPTDTNIDPNNGNVFDILTMRVGKIVQWEPDRVQIEVYNDALGRRELVKMMKRSVAIVENPFYHVMNEPNSTLKRLVRKLSLMDSVDDEIGSKKLDVIIQLPYVVKNKTKQEQAEERRKALEEQLVNSQLGVGYIDGTERIVQLNRSLENNLMKEVETLTSMLYSQLGLTTEIMNGTATEAVMMNYYKRTIDVILQAVCDEFERKFLSKTARTQHQAIQFYRDPFSLTPTTIIADIADKFTRNEILSPNEVRGIVGFMPSKDDAANELRNRNISQANDAGAAPFAETGEGGESEDGSVAGIGSSGEKVPLTSLVKASHEEGPKASVSDMFDNGSGNSPKEVVKAEQEESSKVPLRDVIESKPEKDIEDEARVPLNEVFEESEEESEVPIDDLFDTRLEGGREVPIEELFDEDDEDEEEFPIRNLFD